MQRFFVFVITNFQASSFSISAQDLALALKDIDDAVELLK